MQYFPKLKLNQDELDVLILLIKADYRPKNNEELGTLLSSNFNLDYENVLIALQAKKAYIAEDYEKQS